MACAASSTVAMRIRAPAPVPLSVRAVPLCSTRHSMTAPYGLKRALSSSSVRFLGKFCGNREGLVCMVALLSIQVEDRGLSAS
jgi:hypothetical protein